MQYAFVYSCCKKDAICILCNIAVVETIMYCSLVSEFAFTSLGGSSSMPGQITACAIDFVISTAFCPFTFIHLRPLIVIVILISRLKPLLLYLLTLTIKT